MFWLFLLRNWKWVVGAVATLVLLGTVGFLKVELSVAQHRLVYATETLAKERLVQAEALSKAKKEVLETQDRAADLVHNSAKSFDEKIAAIRSRYAARPGHAAHPAGQHAGGGVLVPSQAPAGGVQLPPVTGTPSQPDGTAPDAGLGSVTERCAETTQQLLDLQDYVRGLQKLYNAR